MFFKSLILRFSFSLQGQKQWESLEEQHSRKPANSECFMAEQMTLTSPRRFLTELAPKPLLLYVFYSSIHSIIIVFFKTLVLMVVKSLPERKIVWINAFVLFAIDREC